MTASTSPSMYTRVPPGWETLYHIMYVYVPVSFREKAVHNCVRQYTAHMRLNKDTE